MANICFTTVPLLIILLMNTILYILTWKRIRDETIRLGDNLGREAAARRASHRAAKAMSLFVAAFFIQWWAMALYGIWGLAGDVPQVIFHLVTTFSNLGGILNLGVYIIIRRKNLSKGEKVSSADGLTAAKGSKGPSTLNAHNPITEIQMSEFSSSPRSSNYLQETDMNLGQRVHSYAA